MKPSIIDNLYSLTSKMKMFFSTHRLFLDSHWSAVHILTICIHRFKHLEKPTTCQCYNLNTLKQNNLHSFHKFTIDFSNPKTNTQNDNFEHKKMNKTRFKKKKKPIKWHQEAS